MKESSDFVSGLGNERRYAVARDRSRVREDGQPVAPPNVNASLGFGDRPGRWRRTISALLAALALGVAGGWAGRTLLAPPAALPADQTHSVVDATNGFVSRSIGLSATAAWTGGGTITNRAEGTVTKVHVTGARAVKPGAALYDVDLAPVRVAAGAIPAFRALEPGVEGEDVRQLQAMLRALGWRTAVPTGRYDAATTSQVRAWQRASGDAVTGTISLGRLLFVPTLPATVALGDGIAVGRQVSTSGGDGPSAGANETTVPGATGAVVRILPAAPQFSISLPENQSRLVRVGMPVTIKAAKGRWSAVIGSIGAPTQDGSAVAALESAGSGPICGATCADIPVSGSGGLAATIALVPETKGVVVPAAALVVGADGSTAVRGEDGADIPVTVKASSGGRAVVDGIATGTRVRVPGRVE